MNEILIWKKIIAQIPDNVIELPTVPKTKRIPVSFKATTDGSIIYMNKAKENRHSSKLSMERRLTYKIFEKVLPLYLRRENGEAVSREVTAITLDQVYYFSLISNLCR